MPDTSHDITAERNQSKEYGVSQAAQRDAAAMSIFVKDYHADIIASLRSAMANPHNEAHLAGGAHGDPTNAVGDDARNELAAKSADSPMKSYEAGIMEKQSVDSKYVHTPTTGDAFKASDQAQQFAQEMQGWMALEAHEPGSGLMAEKAPAVSAGKAEIPNGLDEATAQSAQEGVLGKGNPVTGKEKPQGAQQMDAAKSQVQQSGAIMALKESGVSIGKESLFGDSGKNMGAAPAVTPGQKEFTAAKREQQSEAVTAGR